jgi:hypothetical protein
MTCVERQIGRHTLRFSPESGLFHMIPRGGISAADLEQILEFVREQFAGRTSILALVDGAELGEVPAEIRKIGARESSKIPYAGIAVYGSSFAARIVIRLVSVLIRKPVRFFATEGEARAWLAECATSASVARDAGAR